jgi:4-diphosphocytidyl-2-C-methyl-D-erythritol kinase
MLIHRRGPDLVVRAAAKVNLYLEVLGKRADGYHELETLMAAVGLYDSLALRDDPSGEVRLSCDRPDLATGPDNLVVRAAELLKRRTGHAGGAAIRLWKRIPLQAGLAGGSSDAAATLAGLNRLWRLGLTAAELARIGAEVGSDVAFFLAGPAAWCTGRGEVTEPLRLGRPLDLVLVCPREGLSTAAVFRRLTPPAEPHRGDAVRAAAAAGDVEALGRALFNRLGPVAEELCPAVRDARRALEELHPAGVLMSGSGSTVFAVCRGPGEACRVARELRSAREATDGPRVFVVQSCP